MNPEKRTILPAMAFSSFRSRYETPSLSEGFEDITEVSFEVSGIAHHSWPLLIVILQFDGNTEERQIWTRHWS